MKRTKIKTVVMKESTGYCATSNVDNRFIATEAETFEELKEEMVQALNFTFEDVGIHYSADDLRFEFDLESFFDFYRVINVKALSERIGMNQSLLAQYIRGLKKPSKSQTRRILQGVQQIGRELSEVKFHI